jgi:hypothetical protein
MNTIPERTSKIRTNLKKHFVHNSISGRQFIRNQAKTNNDKITIMEMWENYLTFTRLEF